MYDTSMNSASATWYHVAASHGSDTGQARACTPKAACQLSCEPALVHPFALLTVELVRADLRELLIGRLRSLTMLHTHIHTAMTLNPSGGEEGLFLESRGGRALVVGGLGSWQQFRCLLIMCQLLRWTRVRTHRSPSPRFITVARQRSCWACVCDSGGNPAVHNRREVLVLAQRVTNSTDVPWKCRFKRRTVRRRLLGGPSPANQRANVLWIYLHPEPLGWPPPLHPHPPPPVVMAVSVQAISIHWHVTLPCRHPRQRVSRHYCDWRWGGPARAAALYNLALATHQGEDVGAALPAPDAICASRGSRRCLTGARKRLWCTAGVEQ